MAFGLTDIHGLLALAGVLAAVGSAIVLKRSENWTGQLSGFATVVLAVTVVTGVLLWLQGFRPAGGILSLLHIILGLGALVHAILAMRPRPANVKRHTLILAGVMGLLALLIGHLG